MPRSCCIPLWRWSDGCLLPRPGKLQRQLGPFPLTSNAIFEKEAEVTMPYDQSNRIFGETIATTSSSWRSFQRQPATSTEQAIVAGRRTRGDVVRAAFRHTIGHAAMMLVLSLFVFVAGSQADNAPRRTCEKVVIAGWPDYPPLSWDRNGEQVGAGQELAREIFAELGIPVEVRTAGSFDRIREFMTAGTIDLVPGLYFSEARTAFAVYVTTSFASDPVEVLQRRDDGRRLVSWSDLVGLRGVKHQRISFGDAFNAFSAGNLSILEVPNPSSPFAMLQAGRVDFVISTHWRSIIFDQLLDHAGDGGFVQSGVSIEAQKIYFAFSRFSACAALASEVDRLLQQRLESGAVKVLFDKWLDAGRIEFQPREKGDRPLIADEAR